MIIETYNLTPLSTASLSLAHITILLTDSKLMYVDITKLQLILVNIDDLGEDVNYIEYQCVLPCIK
jgi:hypothetical protein